MKRELIIVGDRVLIKPDNEREMTSSGLYLPQGTLEREKVHSGKVVKAGPGFPVPSPLDVSQEPWKEPADETRQYFPLQAWIGDRAIFLRSSSVDLEYEETKYVIVPHAAILALIRYEIPEKI